jgi:hypothetical protein
MQNDAQSTKKVEGQKKRRKKSEQNKERRLLNNPFINPGLSSLSL